jgi:hypothetical protein
MGRRVVATVRFIVLHATVLSSACTNRIDIAAASSLRDAADPATTADAAAIVMDEGLAHLCLLKPSTLSRAIVLLLYSFLCNIIFFRYDNHCRQDRNLCAEKTSESLNVICTSTFEVSFATHSVDRRRNTIKRWRDFSIRF